ncbi:hypothetical protein DYH09_17735, partial [bacterium CPR1]|nr:hypothetical protein [bacterium CPR1]
MQLSTESIERPAVFISCLGTSPYRELTYAPIDPLEAQAEPTRFVQAARLSALKAKGVHLSAAYILVTEQARTRNWEDFDHSIPSSGGSVRLSGLANELKRFEIEATTEDIPRGEKLEEFWQIFDLVARLVPEKADLYVDLTHGFRTLPILVLLALEYVEMVNALPQAVALASPLQLPDALKARVLKSLETVPPLTPAASAPGKSQPTFPRPKSSWWRTRPLAVRIWASPSISLP